MQRMNLSDAKNEIIGYKEWKLTDAKNESIAYKEWKLTDAQIKNHDMGIM